MKRQRVIWRLGFDQKQDFFHLHCPAEDYSRVKLCDSAITLLIQAWPHLRVSRKVEDVNDVSSYKE